MAGSCYELADAHHHRCTSVEGAAAVLPFVLKPCSTFPDRACSRQRHDQACSVLGLTLMWYKQSEDGELVGKDPLKMVELAVKLGIGDGTMLAVRGLHAEGAHGACRHRAGGR